MTRPSTRVAPATVMLAAALCTWAASAAVGGDEWRILGDDAGQLGAPAPSICTAGGQQVPCARLPVRGPSIGTADGVAALVEETGRLS